MLGVNLILLQFLLWSLLGVSSHLIIHPSQYRSSFLESLTKCQRADVETTPHTHCFQARGSSDPVERDVYL